jgi:hypothetical protein
MALIRAPRHAAIAVMALTASTHAAAQEVGIINPEFAVRENPVGADLGIHRAGASECHGDA